MSPTRLIVPFSLATALAIGAVVALATGAWWALAVALAVHAVATVTVLAATGHVLRQHEKPDPYTEAKEQEEARKEPHVRRRHKDHELIT